MAGWVRVETRFPSHPKVLDIGPLGEALWLRGLCYAGEQLTDGFVPATFLRRMGDMKAIAVATRLVSAGLWTAEDGGYRIHDYLDWQQSRDEVSEISSKRAEAGRRGGKQKASNLLANCQEIDKQNASKVSSKTLPEEEVDKEVDRDRDKNPPKPPRGRRSVIETPDFIAFYDLYPRHQARDEAWQAWQKLKPDEMLIAEIMAGLRGLIPEYQARAPDKVPLPATFLNWGRWKDAPIQLMNGGIINGHVPRRTGGAAAGGMTPQELDAYAAELERLGQ